MHLYSNKMHVEENHFLHILVDSERVAIDTENDGI